MDKRFQIGDFCFRLRCEGGITPPKNFMKFEVGDENPYTYSYEIKVTDPLPSPRGNLLTERMDLKVYETEVGEERLIGTKGIDGYYAYYRELDEENAEIWFAKERMYGLDLDPKFTSLLALERHMVRREQLIFHCAFIEHRGKAILFSAPSETGKTTQANLWEKYRQSRTINGDRALLTQIDGVWMAQGWPVCGTSEVCLNEALPIHAIVMLSQAKENHVRRICGREAFMQVYSQVMVNRWNREASNQAMDRLLHLLEDIPVYHLGCDISEEAVQCLERALY